MSNPVLGRIKQDQAKDKLALTQKLLREQALKQGYGSDFIQEAIVVEIDPIGGMLSDPLLDVGNPRFSIRARLLESNGDNINEDSLRDTDELKVCFPALDMYHVHYPLKIGEKVWVFDKTGIDGVSQRFWLTRSPSLTPLSLEPFARPTNNYANAAFEMNLFRTEEDLDGEYIDANLDAQRADIVDRLSQVNPNEFSSTRVDESNSNTYFSNAVDREAARFGFVNESFPELFVRPSDYLAQGSNNHALILGTNIVSIESDDEVPDIADILQMYGYTNDSSGFTNDKDQSVNIGELSPISANSDVESAFADLVAGRRYNLLSYTFDKSRVAVFENTNVDGLIPSYGEVLNLIKGSPAPRNPAILARTNNARMIFRDSFALSVGSECGLYMDTESGGKLTGNIPLKIDLDVSNVELDISENNFILNVGGRSSVQMNDSITFNSSLNTEFTSNSLFKSTVGPTSITLNPGALTLTTAQLNLASSNISFGGMPVVANASSLSFGGGTSTGIMNYSGMSSISGPTFAAIQASIAGLPPIAPVTGAQIIPALQAIAVFMQKMSDPSIYSNKIKV